MESLSQAPQDDEVTRFAETDFRGKRQTFGIRRRDRRHHMYILGKTGMGKSTLLKKLILTDLQAGNGLALVDPHVDLAEAVIRDLPAMRQRQLIGFAAADLTGEFGYNPLHGVDPARRHLAASGVVGAFRKTWADFWGPRMEYILYNAVRALLDCPEASLLDLPRLLTDDLFRR